jgi:hypothetical protein
VRGRTRGGTDDLADREHHETRVPRDELLAEEPKDRRAGGGDHERRQDGDRRAQQVGAPNVRAHRWRVASGECLCGIGEDDLLDDVDGEARQERELQAHPEDRHLLRREERADEQDVEVREQRREERDDDHRHGMREPPATIRHRSIAT